MSAKKLITNKRSEGGGYSSDEGTFQTFSLKTGVCGYPYSCREEFSYVFRCSTKFVIFNSDISITKLNEFFSKIEKKLKLKKSLVFYATNIQGYIAIELNSFWTENITRRQLFTLFLRAALYYTDDFDKAINLYHLTRGIKPTINHFLKGNVHPTYKRWGLMSGNNAYKANGFYDKFSRRDMAFIKKSLVKKKIIS